MPRAARIALLLLLVAGVAVGAYFAYEHFREKPPENTNQPQPAPLPAQPKGKLVVLVVFDQMRGDYLAKWAPHFGPDGFERVKRDGIWYADAHVPYSCASTGPGHASLSTGAPPAVTGIIENEWFERTPGVMGRVYCCQPTRPYELVPPPPKDGAASRGTDLGFSPERQLAETVSDKLKAATNGTGRVFSLSIKDRTAVLMGGKKPDGVYCFDTRDGLFHTGTYYRDEVHPWVAEFNATKPAEKWFDATWERFRPELDYAAIVGQSDDAAGEGYGLNDQGRRFPHPFKGKLSGPGPAYYAAVECSPAANELLFDLAKRAITAEKLGQGDTTDLLCVSFSGNDLIGHLWGPDSWEMFDITQRSDKMIAELLAFLDATVGKDRYTLVITADHGVCPLPEREKNPYPTARRVMLTDKKNEVFVPLAAALNTTFGPAPGGTMQWFETPDAKEQDRLWPWIHLNHAAIKARNLTPEEVAVVVRDWLAGQAFVETAFTRKQLETETFAPGSFGAKAKLAYHKDRCGDAIAVVKPGVLVTRYENGTNHGTPQPYDTHIPILAVGPDIPKLGKREVTTSSLIVAPILSRALGIDPPKDAAEKLPTGWTK